MNRSHANGNGECQAGNSFANGSPVPSWLQYNWEFREVREAQYSIWDHMP
ncbi:MAG TPA: hypothetical protein VL551_01515 [Actinospica sp.]|jgi:hypothetical protein|nr:hypothetical protein [Actinospica sp.]